MGLQLKLAGNVLSADGTTLLVQDITGAYDAGTNPGGYGTPNPDVPGLNLLRWKMFQDVLWTTVQGGYSHSDIATGYSITNINLGKDTIASLLPDGVEQVQYLAGYAVSGGSVTLTPGSKVVPLGPLDPSKFPVGTYISFANAAAVIFQVTANDSTNLTLDSAYQGTATTDTVNSWYSVIENSLVQTYATRTIQGAMANVTYENLEGQLLIDLCTGTMYLDAAVVKFDAGDLFGADAITIALYKKCFKAPGRW